MKKMKTKRYQEGMSVEGDYESSDDYKNLISAAAREKADAEKPDASAAPAKAASFGEAFKSARGRGDKTFEYMGKKYTTEMAGGKKAPAAASTPAPARSPRMADTGDETERLARRYPSPVPRASLSDRSAAKAEGSFLDRQAYKRATQAEQAEDRRKAMGMKKGGVVSSASKRADGCAMRGKTKGRMV